MVTSIVSVLTGIPVRRDVAMTGEVTLRGRVLPIGGLAGKTVGGVAWWLKTVLIPVENEKDLAEIPANVKKGLEIVPVAMVDEVLSKALVSDITGRIGRNRRSSGGAGRCRGKQRQSGHPLTLHVLATFANRRVFSAGRRRPLLCVPPARGGLCHRCFLIRCFARLP